MLTLASLLRQRSGQFAERPAIVLLHADLASSESLTHAELARAAEAVAVLLLTRVRRGDRVLLAYDNCLDAVLLFWGCVIAGVVAVPAPAPDAGRSTLSWRRLESMCEDADASLAFTHGQHLEAAQSHVAHVNWCTLDGLGDWRADSSASTDRAESFTEVRSCDTAYLQYTSGSTGRPRGVQITHENMLAQCEALVLGEAVDQMSSRALTWLPWFHDYGLVHSLLMPAYTGTTSFLMSTQQFLIRPLRWLEAISRHGITHSGAPDFAYQACVEALARYPDWDFPLDGWKLATCGAEPIRPTTLRRFAASFSRFGFRPEAFAPSYGLAEAVLAVSLGNSREAPQVISVDGRLMEEQGHVREAVPTSHGARDLVGSGRVLPGLEVCIVHPQTLTPCQPDEVGEIWVRGPTVGHGYWNDPAASTERFGGVVKDGDAGQVFLRTGDLGFLMDRELFVTGRHSDLIVVNGRNIHPQDLEETAVSFSDRVRPKGVVACPVEHAGRERPVLLVECRAQLPSDQFEQLQAELRRVIADAHEVELLDVVLLRGGTLPRTSSGKLQRGDARRMYLAGDLAARQLKPVHAPVPWASGGDDAFDRTVAELAALWAEVLNLPAVPADAHFLHLGGDSLTGTQLLSRVRHKTGIDLPISVLFGDPTLLGMARALARRQASRQAPEVGARLAPAHVYNPTAPNGLAGPVRLSYSQERMWFMQVLAPGSSAYNVPLALRLRGDVDVGAMERAFEAVVNKHEILRTRFASTDAGPVAELVDHGDFRVTTLDATAEEFHDDPSRLDELISGLSQQVFELDRWPLMRGWLIRCGPGDHVLLVVMHHIVADQWSFSVLGRDLSAAYALARAHRVPRLPGPQPRFSSYASWHRRWFESERQPLETAYWVQRLAGLRPVALVPDRMRPHQLSYRGASVRVPLPPAAVERLGSLAADQGATLAMAFLALFKVLLQKHTGQKDLAIGLPIANRHHPGCEQLIGTLVNTLIIRTSLEGDPDFVNLLGRVKFAALEAYEHQDMPFELLVRTLDHQRAPGQPPLFNVMFNLVNTPIRDVDFEGLSWARLDVDRRAAQVDLTMVVDPYLDRSIVLEFATDLFDHASVQRMADQLLVLLELAINHAREPVSAWSVLDPRQHRELLSWGAGRNRPLHGIELGAMLEHGLTIDSEAAALIGEAGRLSYRDLDEASRQLADRLRNAGYGPGARIGLCLPRSFDLIVALLGTLRCGAAYVPLDPTYPEERIAYQIQNAELALVIGTTVTLQKLSGSTAPSVTLDQDIPDALPPARPYAAAEGAAYLIYTSGSTGVPKGVVVPRSAVANFLGSMAHEPGLRRGDRVLAVTTLGFDIAVLELLLPLTVGATIVLASDGEASDGEALWALIKRHGITLMQATPSRWQLLIEGGLTRTPGLRGLVGGEPLPSSLARALLERCDEVWNMYGPTETTVWSSCGRVVADAPIALGRAVDNTQLMVLDDAARLQPAGAWGEIWIGGAGVATGYWQQAELTHDRFRTLDHLGDIYETRFYRTGDRGRWRHDGSLEHGGRFDDQVKLRGFRIELGEIEARVLGYAGVQRCVAAVREDRPGEPRLVVYLVTKQSTLDVEDLRRFLRKWLPDHMVPGSFVQLPAIPVLPNGKTDRQSLPAPGIDATASARRLGPCNETEQRLWTLWGDVLEREDFGVSDNFFDLGGHSMLAVRLIRRVEIEFSCSLGLTAIFEHPTVWQMAHHLHDPSSQRDKSIALLRQGQHTSSLFLLAGAQMYQTLARRLSVDVSVYGLFTQAEIDLLERPEGHAAPRFEIDNLADAYLRLIRAQQAHGPYLLGGYSIGGVIAYQVARRLMEQGEEVSLLAMLDCALPGRGWAHLKDGLVRRARLIRRDGWEHVVHLYRQLRHTVAAQPSPGRRRIEAYADAIRRYAPRPLRTPVVFFQASEDIASNPAYGWDALASGMLIERVPGKHSNMLDMPNVERLAARLSWHLASSIPSKG